MKAAFDFIVNHKEVLIPVVLLAISEAQALNPKWKSSGIIDFCVKFLNKQLGK